MGYELTLEIEGLPKTRNEITRKHWAIQSRESRKWKRLIEILARPKRPKEPLAKATLTLTRYSSRECDHDGLVSTFKHIIDGLVVSGVLLDDRPSVIGSPTYLWEKVHPKQGKIKIQVFA